MKKFSSNIQNVWENFVSLIFPELCINCDELLLNNENYLCTQCKFDLPYTKYHKDSANPLINKFIIYPKVKFASSLFFYKKKGVASKLVFEMKYHKNYNLGVELGRWLAWEYDQSFFSQYDFLIPVPLHNKKLKKRGFNQCQALCEGFSEISSIPINNHLVQREHFTKTQTKKSLIDRHINVSTAFEITSTDEILKNKSVILIDDVITTGATIGSICQILEEHGIEKIAVLSIGTGIM